MCKMIEFRKGNIFDFEGQTIVNPINCVGVMGAGLALQFRQKYPGMFEQYKIFCNNNLLSPGTLWIWKDEKWVLNFPTKVHWKDPSKYEYIEKGLIHFVETYKEHSITSIAFPLLGTGLGHLVKDDVKLLMTKYLNQCDIPIIVYEN